MTEEIKLLTWNVFMLPPPINFSKQKLRASHISQKLVESDYDIILLQEAFMNSTRKSIARSLKEKYPYQEHLRKSKKLLHFVNSGLFIASKFPLKVLGYHYYNNCTHSDCLSSKGVLLVEVTTRTGLKLQVAMTHLQAWEDEKAMAVRTAQFDEIKTLLNKHLTPNVPQILAGDLNVDGKLNIEYPQGLEHLGMTSTPLSGPIMGTNGFSVDCYKIPDLKSQEQWLDHVWVKENNTNIKVLRKTVVPFTGILNTKECSLSDHHGVEAIIQL